MQQFNGVSELIQQYKSLPYGRIYIESNSKNELEQARFWVLSSKEAKDQDFIETDQGLLPESLAKLNVSSFLDVATFQDIIDERLERSKAVPATPDFIRAINHYLAHDEFEQ